MLILGAGNSPERGAEAHADTMLRLFARSGQAGVFERQPRRCNGELRVAIQPLQAMRWEVIFRNPIANFTGAVGMESCGVERRYAPNPTLLRANPAPEIFFASADASDRSNAGDDGAPLLSNPHIS